MRIKEVHPRLIVFLAPLPSTDIKERFTNCILLLIVCLRNMEQFSWNPGKPTERRWTWTLSWCTRQSRSRAVVAFSDHLWVLFPDVVMVLASEVAVDVVKHAFITKFNDISADVSLFCPNS